MNYHSNQTSPKTSYENVLPYIMTLNRIKQKYASQTITLLMKLTLCKTIGKAFVIQIDYFMVAQGIVTQKTNFNHRTMSPLSNLSYLKIFTQLHIQQLKKLHLMNNSANYLNFFIEAFKSLQNQNQTSVAPKSQSKVTHNQELSEVEQQKSPAYDEEKNQISKLNLCEADLIKFGSGSTKKYWSPKEDKILISLAEKYDCDWELIAQKLLGRNKKMCYSRYQRILLEAKDVWKPQQNAEIKRLYEKEKLSWREISFYFPNRSAKQLRQHYIGYLRPNINNAQWKLDQDLKLISLFNQYGKKWKFFQSFFQGRTQNQLKNRYYGRLQKLHFKKMKEECLSI